MKHTEKLLVCVWGTGGEAEEGRSIWIATEQDVEGYMVYDHIRKHSHVWTPALQHITHTNTCTPEHPGDAARRDLFVLLVQWTEAMEVVTVWW